MSQPQLIFDILNDQIPFFGDASTGNTFSADAFSADTDSDFLSYLENLSDEDISNTVPAIELVTPSLVLVV